MQKSKQVVYFGKDLPHEKNKSLREALLGILKVITQNTNLLKER